MNKINALSKETFKLYDTANVVLPAESIIYIGCCEEFLKPAFQVSALCLLFRANARNASLANLYGGQITSSTHLMKPNNCVICSSLQSSTTDSLKQPKKSYMASTEPHNIIETLPN